MWAVHIGPGVGHELANTVNEGEWYGPYNRETAEAIEAEVNAMYEAADPTGEAGRAAVVLLAAVPRPTVIAHVREDIDRLLADRDPAGE